MLLSAYGLSVDVPTGWEGRIFSHPDDEDNVGAATMQVASFSMPAGESDFGHHLMPALPANGSFFSLTEFIPDENLVAGEDSFETIGFPIPLSTDDFDEYAVVGDPAPSAPTALQSFFTVDDRPFCLYTVLGDVTLAPVLITAINDVLTTIVVSRRPLQMVGELRAFPFDPPPEGWARCDGALLLIEDNPALFDLLGSAYGGDGTTTFALPDLRGRVPVHSGGGLSRGQAIGEESHALITDELPSHSHAFHASPRGATSSLIAGKALASFANGYVAGPPNTTLASASIDPIGGGQGHENRPPYLALNWCIALVGLMPT